MTEEAAAELFETEDLENFDTFDAEYMNDQMPSSRKRCTARDSFSISKASRVPASSLK